MTMLYGRAAEDIALQDAIRLAPDGSAALLASPAHYRIAQVRDGICHGPDGSWPMADVFEARVFSPDLEVRWLHQASGTGRAVVLAEQEDRLPVPFGQPVTPLKAIDVISQQYLLWGQPSGPSTGGWTGLYSARVGQLAVPVAASGRGRRVRLKTREYVAVEQANGNAYVAEERLLGLEEDTR